jgi:glucosylceramidase
LNGNRLRSLFTNIGHFSRYIEPGAKRIASTKYTDKIDVVSLKNPNGDLVIVFLNRSNEVVQVALRFGGLVTSFPYRQLLLSLGLFK